LWRRPRPNWAVEPRKEEEEEEEEEEYKLYSMVTRLRAG
jgi:hypothetical protein